MAEATGLFLADGEDAGTTPWEFATVTNGTNNTFALSASAKLHEDYGYKFVSGGTNEGGYARINISAVGNIYARFYIYASPDFALGSTYDNLSIFQLTSGGTVRLNFQLNTVATTTVTRWNIVGTSLTSTATTTGYAAAEWVRCDFHWYGGTGDSDGGAEVWINGTSIFSELNHSLSAYTIDRLYFGAYAGAIPPLNDYLDYDDLKLDTSYIGAYPESSEILRFLPESLGLRALGGLNG